MIKNAVQKFMKFLEQAISPQIEYNHLFNPMLLHESERLLDISMYLRDSIKNHDFIDKRNLNEIDIIQVKHAIDTNINGNEIVLAVRYDQYAEFMKLSYEPYVRMVYYEGCPYYDVMHEGLIGCLSEAWVITDVFCEEKYLTNPYAIYEIPKMYP